MSLDPALWLTLISSNCSCLEHIFMIPKVFEQLKFYCIICKIILYTGITISIAVQGLIMLKNLKV